MDEKGMSLTMSDNADWVQALVVALGAVVPGVVEVGTVVVVVFALVSGAVELGPSHGVHEKILEKIHIRQKRDFFLPIK